jgi:hypothetical protein
LRYRIEDFLPIALRPARHEIRLTFFVERPVPFQYFESALNPSGGVIVDRILFNLTMLSESFITSIRAQPKSANTAIAKDVGIYQHELHPTHTVKSSFKKSSTPVNALAANSSHIFAAQTDKAVVHVYSRERGNQEALISFPERIHSLTLVGDGALVLGTAEGRIILWEVGLVKDLKL